MEMQSNYKEGDVTVKPEEGQWTSGLFDCCHDPLACLKSHYCSCIAAGQMIEIIDRGETRCGKACCIFSALHVVHCTCFYTGKYRTKLRALFGLPEAPCGDVLVHAFCCVCAISQEYRELKNRGVDPSLGWEGNVEIWKQEGVTVPPLFPSDMAR